MILVFWMLSFKTNFSTFIKRPFSSSSLSAIRVVSSAYLSLLIFLPASGFQLVLHLPRHFTWCILLAQNIWNCHFVLQELLNVSKFIWSHLTWSWASLVAPSVKNLLQCRRLGFGPWVGNIPWRRAWQPTPVFLPGESPWTEEPGGLPSMGSWRLGND